MQEQENIRKDLDLDWSSDLGFVIKKINEVLYKNGNANMKALGVTMSQAQFLLYLQWIENQKVGYKDLERHFGVSQATVAGIVARLLEKGMVETQVDPDDARAKQVVLSEKGKKTCEAARVGMLEMEKVMVSGLSDSEHKELLSLLWKVYHNIVKVGESC